MKDRDAPRNGFTILGIGAAACIACCTGPILAFLGGLSIVGLASTLIIGSAGLVIAVATAAAWIVVRRRRDQSHTASSSEPVPVATPIRKR